MDQRTAIIILNWNSSAMTIACLDSLAQIHHNNFKVFVVDNGSIESEWKLIDDYISTHNQLFTLISLQYNYGFTGGNNAGIIAALEQFQPKNVLLLNNDTVVDPFFLREMEAEFLKNENVGIVVPKIYFYDEPTKLYYAGGYINKLSGMGEHNLWKQEDPKDHFEPQSEQFANGCCMLISSKLLDEIGFLNDDFFANIEDVEYSYRALKANFGIIYVPKAIVWHKEGFASRKNKGQWFRIYLCTRNLILFFRERARWYSLFLFVPYFFIRWISYMSLKSILSKDFKSVRSIFLGCLDGITKKLRYVQRPDTIIFRSS